MTQYNQRKIEESVLDRFLDELKSRMAKIKLGDGMAEGTQMGPLISAEHRAKIESYMSVAGGGWITSSAGRSAS